MFELHPKLRQDCHELGRFPLSRLLLMNDSRFPWFILVPEREGIREIFQLDESDRAQLLRESCHLSACIDEIFRPDKLNIAAIGNLAPQLHVHHIARYRSDPLWPSPVWGSGPALPYASAGLDELRARLCPLLAEGFNPKSAVESDVSSAVCGNERNGSSAWIRTGSSSAPDNPAHRTPNGLGDTVAFGHPFHGDHSHR